MSHQTEKLAVVFADICGSTALYDHLGDVKAQRLIASCVGEMSAVVGAHRGRVVKTIGDEILCIFPSAQIGLQAACAMQIAVKNALFEGGMRMQIRVGCHFGEVIHEAGDVFGDTVNVAARIAATARAQQIMTSQAVVDAVPDELRRRTHRIMAAEFKGKQTEFDIFIVAWNLDDTDTTHILAPQTGLNQGAGGTLTLYYGSRQFLVNQTHKRITFGRGDGCDIIVPSNLASRQHGAIELRFGKFFIVDQSANGTFISTIDGNVSHISRQEMILNGRGLISPGQSFAEQPSEVFQFAIEAGR